MSKPIVQLLDGLDERGVTPMVMTALDWVTPGSYKNVTNFTEMIKLVTGETDDAWIQRCGERAIALYNDKSEGYQRAVWTYRTVDEIGERAGQMAIASELGDSFSFLKVLDWLTPKSEKIQAFDFALKAGAEIYAFTRLNGMPGDSFGDFVKSLNDMEPERLMRMTSLVCIDGILPLGPNFIEASLKHVGGMSEGDAKKNDRFKNLGDALGEGGFGGQKKLLTHGLESMGDWMKGFVSQKGITQNKVLESVEKFAGKSDNKLDYLAAFLDANCRLYEHTGIQSVARAAISRAMHEV